VGIGIWVNRPEPISSFVQTRSRVSDVWSLLGTTGADDHET